MVRRRLPGPVHKIDETGSQGRKGTRMIDLYLRLGLVAPLPSTAARSAVQHRRQGRARSRRRLEHSVTEITVFTRLE